MPEPSLVTYWIGLGFASGCVLYGAVFAATAVFSVLK